MVILYKKRHKKSEGGEGGGGDSDVNSSLQCGKEEEEEEAEYAKREGYFLLISTLFLALFYPTGTVHVGVVRIAKKGGRLGSFGKQEDFATTTVSQSVSEKDTSNPFCNFTFFPSSLLRERGKRGPFSLL